MLSKKRYTLLMPVVALIWQKINPLLSNALHRSERLGAARFKFWVMSNLPLLVQSRLICILNYHDSGYTNSSLHLQSSCAHENCDNWLQKQCGFICATDT